MIPNLEKFGYETQTWGRTCVWSRHGKRPASRASRRTSFASGPADARSSRLTFPRKARVHRPGIPGKRFCCCGSPSRCATASTLNCKPTVRSLRACTRVCAPRRSSLSGENRSPSIPINAGRGLTMRTGAGWWATRFSSVYRLISTRSRRTSHCLGLRAYLGNSISSRRSRLPDRHLPLPFPLIRPRVRALAVQHAEFWHHPRDGRHVHRHAGAPRVRCPAVLAGLPPFLHAGRAHPLARVVFVGLVDLEGVRPG